jgi:hypothetical protein
MVLIEEDVTSTMRDLGDQVLVDSRDIVKNQLDGWCIWDTVCGEVTAPSVAISEAVGDLVWDNLLWWTQ